MPPDIPNLSARLWHALLQADKAAAAPLIDDAAVFVHMGATLDKTQELDAIGSLIRLKSWTWKSRACALSARPPSCSTKSASPPW